MREGLLDYCVSLFKIIIFEYLNLNIIFDCIFKSVFCTNIKSGLSRSLNIETLPANYLLIREGSIEEAAVLINFITKKVFQNIFREKGILSFQKSSGLRNN